MMDEKNILLYVLFCSNFTHVYYFGSIIEKIQSDIQREKSRVNLASLGKWSQKLVHEQFQKKGRNRVSERVSDPCWYATPVTNATWKPLVIR